EWVWAYVIIVEVPPTRGESADPEEGFPNRRASTPLGDRREGGSSLPFDCCVGHRDGWIEQQPDQLVGQPSRQPIGLIVGGPCGRRPPVGGWIGPRIGQQREWLRGHVRVVIEEAVN